MVRPFKKLLSKLEIPKNDWVLSRFGGCEPPSDPHATIGEGEQSEEEEAPESQAPTSVAARLLNWFDAGPNDVAPQSGSRMSSNASAAEGSEERQRKSRAS